MKKFYYAYHATNATYDKMDANYIGANSQNYEYGPSFYFSSNPDLHSYGKFINKYKLKIEKPISQKSFDFKPLYYLILKSPQIKEKNYSNLENYLSREFIIPDNIIQLNAKLNFEIKNVVYFLINSCTDQFDAAQEIFSAFYNNNAKEFINNIKEFYDGAIIKRSDEITFYVMYNPENILKVSKKSLNEQLEILNKSENNNIDDYVVKYQIKDVETNEITKFTISIKRFQDAKTKQFRYEPTLFLIKDNKIIKTDYKHNNKDIARLILNIYIKHIKDYIENYNANIFVVDYNNPRFREINKNMFDEFGFKEIFIADNYYKYVK